MLKLDLEKAEEPEIKLLTSTGSSKKQKNIYFCFIDYAKAFDSGDHNKLWKILKEVLSMSVGAQYATGGQWRNNSRQNEGMEPKQKQYPVVDVTGDRSKV